MRNPAGVGDENGRGQMSRQDAGATKCVRRAKPEGPLRTNPNRKCRSDEDRHPEGDAAALSRPKDPSSNRMREPACGSKQAKILIARTGNRNHCNSFKTNESASF